MFIDPYFQNVFSNACAKKHFSNVYWLRNTFDAAKMHFLEPTASFRGNRFPDGGYPLSTIGNLGHCGTAGEDCADRKLFKD